MFLTPIEKHILELLIGDEAIDLSIRQSGTHRDGGLAYKCLAKRFCRSKFSVAPPPPTRCRGKGYAVRSMQTSTVHSYLRFFLLQLPRYKPPGPALTPPGILGPDINDGHRVICNAEQCVLALLARSCVKPDSFLRHLRKCRLWCPSGDTLRPIWRRPLRAIALSGSSLSPHDGLFYQWMRENGTKVAMEAEIVPSLAPHHCQ